MAEPLKVALVHLARTQARGEVRRVASWRTIFEAVGADVVDVALTPSRIPRPDALVPLARGRAVPESLTWSTRRLLERLEEIGPALVVVVSTRAFDLRIADGPWSTVLDYVDSLARSYRDRAAVLGGVRRVGYAALARSHARAEATLGRHHLHTVAAGWADAHRLGAEWVPVVVDPTLTPLPASEPRFDVIFFGTLRYPPNVDALRRLSAIWPRVTATRPGTSALIAGADPSPQVRELALSNDWELVSNYSSLAEVAARARIAVAPLSRTAGIQIKVLDAAVLELPQVVTTAALAGLAPGLPLDPVDEDDALVREILRLLEHPADAAAGARALRVRVAEEYGVPRWASWAKRALFESS